MFQVTAHPPRPSIWWYSHRDEIALDPPYQRKGGVWSSRQKAYLIDSILNQYDMPKLYLADFAFSHSSMRKDNRRFAVIDGRQRLEALFDFFSDQLALDDSIIFFEEPTLRLSGLTYSDLARLHPSLARRVQDFELPVMLVLTDDETRVNDLFVRLNANMKPLTGAEVRNAMVGEVPVIIRSIANHAFYTEKVRFNTLRGADRNSAAKLLLIEFNNQLTDTKKRNLDKLARLIAEAGLDIETQVDDVQRAAERVTEYLDLLDSVFEPHDRLLSSQGPVTIYYWFARNYPPEVITNYFRQFLVSFEHARRQNREYMRAQHRALDDELSVFEGLNRSTNDELSLKGRFKIMSRRFELHLEAQGVDKKQAMSQWR